LETLLKSLEKILETYLTSFEMILETLLTSLKRVLETYNLAIFGGFHSEDCFNIVLST